MAAHVPGPLYLEQIGATGMPMVFLHSTPDDHRLWLFQTAHFSARFRTLAIDLAGYGRSPAVQKGVRIDDQADACWEAIDRIDSGRAIIHGNSMGSAVATAMARRLPHRTAALILSGCGFATPKEVFVRWADRYANGGLPLRYEQLLEHFAPDARTNPYLKHYCDMVVELNNAGTLGSIIAMNEALAEPRGAEYYEALTAPTLIITGTKDVIYKGAFELQKVIPQCELREIEGAGHAVMIEAPWDYDRHAIEFLARHGLYPETLR
jgi:pimeloyl-ACP methyl ester carboxylesterase